MIYFDERLEGYYDFIYKYKLYATFIRLGIMNDLRLVDYPFLHAEHIKRELR